MGEAYGLRPRRDGLTALFGGGGRRHPTALASSLEEGLTGEPGLVRGATPFRRWWR